MPAEPFVREAGAGPGVVCLHANASTSGQWRALMDDLAPSFHLFAPDSYDAGQSPAWPSDRFISLHDEVALIAPVLARAGSPCLLVGHYYGAAIALLAALASPVRGRISALALYEPTLFSLLDAESPPPNEVDGIRQAVARHFGGVRADRPHGPDHPPRGGQPGDCAVFAGLCGGLMEFTRYAQTVSPGCAQC